ncbi:MAG TPA: SAM-dependent methyltransferase [Clostridiales bacterium]|nr:SAM-dependent methyltransferase [Clostridiales bacterium]
MGNEKYFDQNVLMYDQYRPTYGKQIYEDILSVSKITPASRILEIGCGTGNATLPFIQTGAQVTAVELGENLAGYTAEKFSDYPNFKVVNMPFEKYKTDDKYHLIFSATAFHWIETGFGYPRCHELLTDDDILAVFWNTPRISNQNLDLKHRIQELYHEYLDDSTDDINVDEWFEKRSKNYQYIMNLYGYRDLNSKIYFDTRVMNADRYIGLLHTYSNHMALPKSKRDLFFGKIYAVISEYKSVIISDTIDLHMGRK